MPRLVAMGLLAAAALGASTLSGADQRPNVIVILSDDQGYAHLGSYSDLYTVEDLPARRVARTDRSVLQKSLEASRNCMPVIDDLATNGLRFTHALATPTCAPSRAALMLARYPQRLGVYTNLDIREQGLPSDAHFLVADLQEAGYRTAVIGKWHLGSKEGQHPLDRGFDHYFGFDGGQVAKYNSRRLFRNRAKASSSGFLCDQLTGEAQSFIDRTVAEGKPFFLYLAYNEPHGPRPTPPARYMEPFDTGDRRVDEFFAYLYAMDQGIGKVLGTVKKHGQMENTLVLYASDNGANYEMPLPLNGYLTGTKWMIHDGGRKVPMIAYYPKLIKGPRTYAGLVTFLDVMPTILEFTGVAPDAARTHDGISFLEVFRGSNEPVRIEPFFWAGDTSLPDPDWKKYEKRWQAENDAKPESEQLWKWWLLPAGWSVHKGRWKLVKAGPDPIRLYDVHEDPGEKQDLSDRHPDVFRELLDEYIEWIAGKPEPLAWDVEKWKDLFPNKGK